jgi:hypothetical protein
MTIERPMFPPVDPTRRHLLTIAAGGAVAAMAITTTAQAAGEGINLRANTINVLAPKTPSKEITPSQDIEADPAFALIAEKLAADIAHGKACDALSDAEERYGFHSDAVEEAWENSGAACHAADEVGWKLARTVPTTLAGVAAVLRFANEVEDTGNEWPDTDTIGPDGWHYQLRATMAAAVEALIKAQAGKAVQS